MYKYSSNLWESNHSDGHNHYSTYTHTCTHTCTCTVDWEIFTVKRFHCCFHQRKLMPLK